LNNTDHLQPVSIIEQDGKLFSSYSTGNQWWRNGEELDREIDPFITPAASGAFQCTVKRDGCETAATYDFIWQDEMLKCFPNPAANVLTITAPYGELIDQVTVTDDSGRKISVIYISTPKKEIKLAVSDYSDGIYWIAITTKQKRYLKRFLKNSN
jgi:hypothetical protein